MDMCKDRVPLGFLLRLSILLTAVCLGVHLYLETSWQGPPAPLALGLPIQSDQNWDQQTRMKQVSTEAVKQDRNIKIPFVQALKEDSHARREDDDTKDLLSPLQLHRKKTPRWHIDLQPWASESHSLEDEAQRFLSYITTPQVACASLAGEEAATEAPADNWAACLDQKYSLIHRIQSKHCRVYSFGLEVDNKSLERLLSGSGCEVHCFDPSLEQPHLQKANMWFHRLSVHWRDPNPAAAKHQYANTKKLATIFNDFGHRDVDVLKVDMESAEWKILENLVLEGVLASVGQLLLELHLHWAGFEVGGDDPAVVRYWFSLLKELEGANFHLFHVRSDPAKPHLFLQKNILDASSVYKLSWVNTRWKPSRMTEKH